jgi:hypothetical protein
MTEGQRSVCLWGFLALILVAQRVAEWLARERRWDRNGTQGPRITK